MLQYIGTVPNNNCVINRQNLSEQPFGGMRRVDVKCDADHIFRCYNRTSTPRRQTHRFTKRCYCSQLIWVAATSWKRNSVTLTQTRRRSHVRGVNSLQDSRLQRRASRRTSLNLHARFSTERPEINSLLRRYSGRRRRRRRARPSPSAIYARTDVRRTCRSTVPFRSLLSQSTAGTGCVNEGGRLERTAGRTAPTHSSSTVGGSVSCLRRKRAGCYYPPSIHLRMIMRRPCDVTLECRNFSADLRSPSGITVFTAPLHVVRSYFRSAWNVRGTSLCVACVTVILCAPNVPGDRIKTIHKLNPNNQHRHI